MKQIFAFILPITLFIFSCKKESTTSTLAISFPQSGLTTLEPLTLMLNLVDRHPADFSISISSSIGSGLYEPSTLRNGSTSISARHASETFVGKFEVNAYPVPYNLKSYYFQADTNQTSAFLTNRTNIYKLQGASFPTFTLEDYATALPILSYSGISDYKLPLDSSLVVNWPVDPWFPAAGKAIVIVSYEDEQSGLITTFHKRLEQSAGKATFTVSELSAFEGKPFLEIYFAKNT